MFEFSSMSFNFAKQLKCKCTFLCVMLSCCLVFHSESLLAEDEVAEEEASQQELMPSIYVKIKPSFVTNFLTEELRYIKADVAIRVNNAATQNAIEHHMDAVKNGLVMLFSRQEFDTVTSVEGVAAVREEALEVIMEILENESAESEITEVLFTSFIVE